ncbi:hypothetical protein LF817_19080 [Halobacillus sp. A1]|uniref:hypothetical protein n=1 Tax=Halobacillus sp. A1 TaxID=2880262 RepID=UPI0020A6C127|nr:hypothetical protein [Halobacillus sp. A1]MCP3033432.1 hypothetical protein [Halobacillus sp. A1]
MSLAVLVLGFSTSASASGPISYADVPSDPGANCEHSNYLTASEVNELYHGKSDYDSLTEWLTYGSGIAGFWLTGAILGGASLGQGSTGDWINTAHTEGTGVLLCHEGLEQADTYNNQAYYKNPTRYYY